MKAGISRDGLRTEAEGGPAISASERRNVELYWATGPVG